MSAYLPEAQRFWPKVQKTDTCWLWTAALTSAGYGTFWGDGRQVSAHKWAYVDAYGPVPQGREIDHLCRNRACVNPAHLEAVTSSENKRRSPLVGRVWQVHGIQASACVRTARATCPHGHPWTAENTYFRPDSGRHCRACLRIADSKRRAKRKLDRMVSLGENERYVQLEANAA